MSLVNAVLSNLQPWPVLNKAVGVSNGLDLDSWMMIKAP
jgi:hypothetical protein